MNQSEVCRVGNGSKLVPLFSAPTSAFAKCRHVVCPFDPRRGYLTAAPFANGSESSRAHSMKSRDAGLMERPFNVAIQIGSGPTGN
jgi:hypothetical protein